jgi:hypothetical protein
LSVLLVSALGAQDLSGFANDFEALITGITRDVAPNLQMTALSGNVVASARIDKFMVFLPGVGVTLSGGLATIMEPDAYQWSTISLPAVIGAVVEDQSTKDLLETLEYGLFPYPMLKVGFGFGFAKDYDIMISGMYLPGALADLGTSLAGPEIESLGINLETLNLGATVRRTLLRDSGFVPALSLGALYNYSSFNLGIAELSLADLVEGGVDLGGLTLDLTGSLGFETVSHNFGLELHASKKLLFFTPYIKLSGIYQITSTSGTTDLTATVGPVVTDIDTGAEAIISNFSALATVGFNLLVFNFNAVIDVARAELDVQDFSLSGIKGQGISFNVGICVQL